MGGSSVPVYDDWEITSPANGAKNLVLVGRTGNGKSATANSILGSKKFISNNSSAGVTRTCELQSTMLEDGQNLNIIDTPGLFDVSVPPEFIAKEVAKCIDLAKDGIHAVLVVLSVRNRFSSEEKEALHSLRTMFGTKIENYTIVVFTGSDDFDEEETFEDYLGSDCPQPLKDILQLCENRFVLFDNKTKDVSIRAKQVENLLSLVNTVVAQNGGKPYSDDLFVELKKIATIGDQQKGHSDQEISELKERVERLHQEQLGRIAETVESKMKEATARLEKQLKEAQAAQNKAEKEAKFPEKKTNDEIKMLKEVLDRAQREAQDLRRQLDSKCSIQRLAYRRNAF